MWLALPLILGLTLALLAIYRMERVIIDREAAERGSAHQEPNGQPPRQRNGRAKVLTSEGAERPTPPQGRAHLRSPARYPGDARRRAEGSNTR
jgi:hypothetical protein